MTSVWRDEEPLRRRRHRSPAPFPRRATLLATGGYAALWERTTNPPERSGRASRSRTAPAPPLADLEFVQFHPTALVDCRFLLSEALRGEGASSSTSSGDRFTDELAPRDVVARAIAARGTALLDLRAIERGRFPGLMASARRGGLRPGAEPIPVAPAAHYTVGGIVTDLDGATRCRASTPRASAPHRRARREPARLELAARVPRLRAPRGARRARRAELPRFCRSRPPAAAAEPVTPELRAALWRDAG